MDLRQVLWGSQAVGARRLWSLVKGLPVGSATHRSMDPEGWNWTNTDELLASLIEVTDMGNRLYLAVHKKPHTPDPKPVEVPRPGQAARRREPEPRKTSTPAEVKRFMGSRIKVDKEAT